MEDFGDVPITGETHQEFVHNLAVGQLLEMHAVRDGKQGNAWAKRGFSGFWYFFANHWDRLEVIFNKYLDSGRDKAHIVNLDLFEALMDVAMYSLKFATVLAQLDSNLAVRWRQRWQEVQPLIEGSIGISDTDTPPPAPNGEEEEEQSNEKEVWGKPLNEDGLTDMNL